MLEVCRLIFLVSATFEFRAISLVLSNFPSLAEHEPLYAHAGNLGYDFKQYHELSLHGTFIVFSLFYFMSLSVLHIM
jgi:hypothetical protein